jgi:hypothetical protein
MSCAHASTCPLYALFTVKASLRVWQIHYCDGRFEDCARLKLAKAGEAVPAELLPNGKRLAVGPVRR